MAEATPETTHINGSAGPALRRGRLEIRRPNGGDPRPSVSIVVPLHNEAPTLAELFERIAAALRGESFEVLFVDDGSTDGSDRVLADLARRDGRAQLIRLRGRSGKSAALSAGLRESAGRAVITIDADLQDDPAEIPALLATLRSGYDVVSGWKEHRRDPLTRRLASRVFNRVTSRLSGVRLHDVNCGLKAYSGECAREIASACTGEMHRFLPVIAASRGFRVTERAVRHHPRTNGRSRYGLERYLRGALDLVTVTVVARFARRPMHLLGGIAIAMLLAGAGLLTVAGIAPGVAAPVPLVAGAALCIVAVQLAVAGLIVEYVTTARRDAPYRRVLVIPEAREESRS